MFRKQLIAVLFTVTALSAARFDDKVRNDFFSGFFGNQAALERGLKVTEEVINSGLAEKSPDLAEALAWHGSGLMFLSGQKFRTGDIAGGTELWIKGNEEMDRAGTLAPDNVGVLIPRASVWFAASREAPPAQGRPLLIKAIADYERVFEIQKSYFDKLGMHPRSELLFGIADGYARTGNPEKAKEYFKLLAELGPASGHLEQANAYLSGASYKIRGAACVGCHTSK